MLRFTIDRKVLQHCVARGADKHAIGTLKGSKFSLEDALISFKPKIHGVTSRTVSQQQQERWLDKLLDNPLRGHNLTVVNSYPSDMRAKHVAVNIMAAAMRQHTTMNPKQRRGKGQPMWHRLYGGLKDKLRDEEPTTKPSMLIISNVIADSSAHKMEKLRDLLEMYDDIPRIVVMGGVVDPITFFGTRIHLPIKNAIHLGSNDKVNPLDI